eukprot:GHVL01016059.1.p1 GENE.GHVL01016059.1~~GHVL01016059.1.p1  ORF type:complete len:149 (+),score=41.34 GHVL01016059.1:56-448(+)
MDSREANKLTMRRHMPMNITHGAMKDDDGVAFDASMLESLQRYASVDLAKMQTQKEDITNILLTRRASVGRSRLVPRSSQAKQHFLKNSNDIARRESRRSDSSDVSALSGVTCAELAPKTSVWRFRRDSA